jgi:CBS domain-containing protein
MPRSLTELSCKNMRNRSGRRGRCLTLEPSEQLESASTTAEKRVRDAMVTEPTTHPRSISIADVKELFLDDHMHMVLLVDENRLVATIEPDDLARKYRADTPAASIGTTDGRTVGPDASLTDAAETMRRGRRRRLAVVDDHGFLIGLLCLKQRGTGFCSNQDVRNRRTDPRNSQHITQAA